jgi:hypothetical protein
MAKTGKESDAQDACRLAASNSGAVLWRNNVGAGTLHTGEFIRWGLANDSTAMNKRVKSADLIGIRPVLIMPHHVGMTLGQFVSREIKHPGWVYKGTDREVAQLEWLKIISAHGGDAQFSTGEWI